MEKKVKKPKTKTKTKTKQKKKTKQVKKTKQKQIQQQSQNVVVNVAPTSRRRRKPSQPRLKNYSAPAPAPVILNPFENVYRDLILPLKEEQRILARQIRGAKLNNYTQPIESQQEQPDRTGELTEQPFTPVKEESSSEPVNVVDAVQVLPKLKKEQLAKLLPEFDTFRRRVRKSASGRGVNKGPDWGSTEVKQLFERLFGTAYTYETIQKYYAEDYKRRMKATRS